ncbi:MAG: Origin recognition complex, subunit 1 [Candelina submexicana]|nr:MAG: Origin recognition complex, subunit 1 [Candelina submexicana]
MPSKVKRARQYISRGGVSREDSDDELGFEDHPWEWIYEHLQDGGFGEAQSSSTMTRPGRRVDPSTQSGTGSTSEKRNGTASQRIVGAHMGNFECRIGDTVLLKAEGTNEAWVGLICDFPEEEEEEDGKVANFMWFSSEKEIRNKQKRRTDTLDNELYITPSWDINPLASINGKASIVSLQTFKSQYPNGRIPKTSKDYGKLFVCRRGCNTRTATYTEEFDWEQIYKGTDLDIHALVERVKSRTKATMRGRGSVPSTTKELDEFAIDEDKSSVPRTPTKKRKLNSASTPLSKASTSRRQKFTTPTKKRIVLKKAIEFTPLGTRIISPSHVTSSPFQIARSQLHVSSVPTNLPCREREFSNVYYHLEAAISEGSGSCIYISGTPGTGKTATVREAVAQLNASVLAEELDDFIFVEINGMKVTDPHQSYSLLWEALKGDRVSPSHALDLLEREFGNPSPRRVPCVVLMDELDQLVTRNQSVMYNFFNWPGLQHSRLIVLAVANTMDLPERTLSNKISSRLGLTRITFPGYTHDQLMKIIQSRLEGVPGKIVDPDAVQFASRKVAAVSGDARRALDICRRAVEIAEAEGCVDAPSPQTPSKKRAAGTTHQEVDRPKGIVTIATVKQAINEATSSPLHQCLRCLPLSSKLLLAAMLANIRRTGIGDCLLGDIAEEAKRIGQLADNTRIHDFIMSPVIPTTAGVVSLVKASKQKLLSAPRVLAMGVAAAELMEAGVVRLEARKGERTGKIRLNVGEEDIKIALKDDPDVGALGFSS